MPVLIVKPNPKLSLAAPLSELLDAGYKVAIVPTSGTGTCRIAADGSITGDQQTLAMVAHGIALLRLQREWAEGVFGRSRDPYPVLLPPGHEYFPLFEVMSAP